MWSVLGSIGEKASFLGKGYQWFGIGLGLDSGTIQEARPWFGNQFGSRGKPVREPVRL